MEGVARITDPIQLMRLAQDARNRDIQISALERLDGNALIDFMLAKPNSPLCHLALQRVDLAQLERETILCASEPLLKVLALERSGTELDPELKRLILTYTETHDEHATRALILFVDTHRKESRPLRKMIGMDAIPTKHHDRTCGGGAG